MKTPQHVLTVAVDIDPPMSGEVVLHMLRDSICHLWRGAVSYPLDSEDDNAALYAPWGRKKNLAAAVLATVPAPPLIFGFKGSESKILVLVINHNLRVPEDEDAILAALADDLQRTHGVHVEWTEVTFQ